MVIDNSLLIFGGIVLVSLIGIIVVVVLISKDKSSANDVVKLDPNMITKEQTLDLGIETLKKDLIDETPEKKKFGLPKLKRNKEAKKEKAPKKPKPVKEKNKQKKSFISKLFKKSKKNPEDDIPQATPFPDLKDKLNAGSSFDDTDDDVRAVDHVSLTDDPSVGTASLTTSPAENIPTGNKQPDDLPDIPVVDDTESTPTLSAQEEEKLDTHIEELTQIDDIKAKYQRIENLLNEKNKELDKVKEELENEVKNRKDFNKVKDILEKEIKEQKDKIKELQRESNDETAITSAKDQQIQKLEEKATMLEKQLAEKEKEIQGLAQSGGTPESSQTSDAPTESTDETSPAEPQEEPLNTETPAEKKYDPKKIEEELGISVKPKNSPPEINNTEKSSDSSQEQQPTEPPAEKPDNPSDSQPTENTPEDSSDKNGDDFSKLQPDVAPSNEEKDSEDTPENENNEDSNDNPEKQNN